MFAKLLAELKRIAILLQSKKLVDKDYNPDEGGTDDKTDDIVVITYLVFNDLTQKGITNINHKILSDDYSQIHAPCLASDLFTTKGIDAINKAIISFKNDINNFSLQENNYYIGFTDNHQIYYSEAFERDPNFTLSHVDNSINININGKYLGAAIDYTSGVLEENTPFSSTQE